MAKFMERNKFQQTERNRTDSKASYVVPKLDRR